MKSEIRPDPSRAPEKSCLILGILSELAHAQQSCAEVRCKADVHKKKRNLPPPPLTHIDVRALRHLPTHPDFHYPRTARCTMGVPAKKHYE